MKTWERDHNSLWFYYRKKRKPDSFDDDSERQLTIGDRIREFLQSLRYFRIFIALWNLFIIACMFM